MHKHHFVPNKHSMCKVIVGPAICGQAKDHRVHFTDKEVMDKAIEHGVKFCGSHLVEEIFPKHYMFCPYCGGDLEMVPQREVGRG